eukprot:6069491-Prymnesium_polylepis.1
MATTRACITRVDAIVCSPGQDERAVTGITCRESRHAHTGGMVHEYAQHDKRGDSTVALRRQCGPTGDGGAQRGDSFVALRLRDDRLRITCCSIRFKRRGSACDRGSRGWPRAARGL